MMVRHILKKDWLLLWPLVAALAVLQALFAFARFKSGPGHFATGVPTVPEAFLELLAAATVIVLVVHQDPIPGVRQDWLIRPIRRRDLFLAKLIFVVGLVQGPWWLSDLFQGLANGFPFSESVAAATASAVWVFTMVSLPVLAFATLTATTTETFLGALGVLVVLISFLIVPALIHVADPTGLTGVAWVPDLARDILLLVAAVAVLRLQYGWRGTGTARVLFVAAIVTGQLVGFLPFRTAFGVEQLLTAGSGGDRDITVTFEPAGGRYQLAPGQGIDDILEKPGFGEVDVAEENQRRRAEGARTLIIPVHMSGLIADSRLLADRSEVRLIDSNGRLRYQGTGNDVEVRAAGADATVHQGIRVPGALYSRVQAEPHDVQIEYSFTLFRNNATYAVPARDGDQMMPGIGRCVTKVDDPGIRVDFQCIQPGERPQCLAVQLEHVPTGQRNPEISLCVPDYTPYRGHTFPDALSRFSGRLPYYDPSGLIRYPVGGPQLSEARVIVTAFQPSAHFVRRVVIPAVRLQDWEPMPAGAAVSQ